MAPPAGKPVRRSQSQFTKPCWTGTELAQLKAKLWPRPTDLMFDVHFKEPHGRLDKLQLVAIVGLMLLGAAFVYSATTVNEPAATTPWYHHSWFRQIIWYMLGIGAATGLCFIDYRIIARWALVVYWITIL